MTPIVIRVARKHDWFDDPSSPRKIHDGKVPRLGGMAIFWAFFIAATLASLLSSRSRGDSPWNSTYLPLSISLAIVHATGLFDDFHDLRARYKLCVQAAAAIIVISFGFRFHVIPFPGHELDLGWASYPITFLWIVGIMNAINFIDGLDGLAGGISIIAAFAYGVIYAALGLWYPSVIAFALVGAIAGFLVYNFPKASIFMGDSGSLFLGFLLAIFPLLHKSSFPLQAGLLPGITVLLVPIYDVFASMIRRTRRGQSVMEPDREHLHHKLLDLGLDVRQILTLVYGCCIFLAGVALGGLFLPARIQFWVFMAAWAVGLVGFMYLHVRWHGLKLPAWSADMDKAESGAIPEQTDH